MQLFKKTYGSDTAALIISNKETENILKIAKIIISLAKKVLIPLELTSDYPKGNL